MLSSYPHVQEQLKRRPFLGTEDEHLLETVWNVPWATAVKWGARASPLSGSAAVAGGLSGMRLRFS
ncbi:MAG: hypothetical protein Kow00129_10580 [Thermoleophilia bacterium]